MFWIYSSTVKASKAIITCVGDFYEAQGGSRENSENAV